MEFELLTSRIQGARNNRSGTKAIKSLNWLLFKKQYKQILLTRYE